MLIKCAKFRRHELNLLSAGFARSNFAFDVCYTSFCSVLHGKSALPGALLATSKPSRKLIIPYSTSPVPTLLLFIFVVSYFDFRALVASKTWALPNVKRIFVI